MAEVLEGSGQRQVVGLRGRGQDVVHALGSLYRGQVEEVVHCSQWTESWVNTGGLGAGWGGREDEAGCGEEGGVTQSSDVEM